MNQDTLTGFALGVICGFCIFGFLASVKRHWLPIIRAVLEARKSIPKEQDIVADVLQRVATKPPVAAAVTEPTPADEEPEQNPIIDGFELSEQEAVAVDKSLRSAKAEMLRLQNMTPGESAGADMQTKLDEASREYGELYYARFKRAPPEWT